MALFSSSKSSVVNQTIDERFVLDPTEGAIALGQSGDSSVLSAPGSLAVQSAPNWQIAGLTLQNFDPAIIERAYSAIDTSNKLIADISSGFFSAQSESQKQALDYADTVSETAKDAATGSTFDVSELAAWAGILGFVWMIWGK